MKIFLAFLQSKVQHPIAAYSFWEFYIKNGIKEAGFEWIECSDVDWAEGLVAKNKVDLSYWKTITWEKTVNYLKENPVDIFLSYLYPHQVDEQAILELKKMGIYCVNFFCDNIRMFSKAPAEYRVFDLNWVPEYKALSFYEKDHQPYIHLPMPMWVEPRYRNPPANENNRVSFIGSKDIQRHLFFDSIVKDFPSIGIDIYGAGWLESSNVQKPLNSSLMRKAVNQFAFIRQFGVKSFVNKIKDKNTPTIISPELRSLIKAKPDFNEYIKISRESLITIGINRYPSFQYPVISPGTYSRLRDIEAPMLGACYLTEYTEGLAFLYDLGTEIETFRNGLELNEKIKILKANPKKRAELREKGQKAALSKHSIVESLRKISERMR